uniref:Uncharacterized protein n=1 Tax=Oryza meridionalis TaxID=40149 RepID=A0A0E0CEB2_9ORYZ
MAARDRLMPRSLAACMRPPPPPLPISREDGVVAGLRPSPALHCWPPSVVGLHFAREKLER